jgi:hypothetical protein
MAKVTDIMDQAALRCRLTIRNYVDSQLLSAQEMRACLSETVEEIQARLDLPSPFTRDTVITGDGGETYAIASDYLRITRDDNAVIETTFSRRRVTPVNDNGAWTNLKIRGAAAGRFYRITGDELNGYNISFYRPLEAGSQVSVSYVSKTWAQNDGEFKSAWTDPNDESYLPADILRLGVIWRFKQSKGLVFADTQSEYEIRMSRLINDSRGIRTIDMGDQDRPAWPYRAEVPDVINFG